MAKLNLFTVLQCKLSSRILQLKWRSKVDHSASLFEQATSYRILRFLDFDSQEEYEKKYLRFYQCPTRQLDLPHSFSYVVWRDSMEVRYHIEMILYGCALIFVTYNLIMFNKHMHAVVKQLLIRKKMVKTAVGSE